MPLITGGRSPQAAKGATRQKADYNRKDPSPAYREVAQHKTIQAPHVPALLSSTYSPANRAKPLPRVSSSLPVFHLPLPLASPFHTTPPPSSALAAANKAQAIRHGFEAPPPVPDRNMEPKTLRQGPTPPTPQTRRASEVLLPLCRNKANRKQLFLPCCTRRGPSCGAAAGLQGWHQGQMKAGHTQQRPKSLDPCLTGGLRGAIDNFKCPGNQSISTLSYRAALGPEAAGGSFSPKWGIHKPASR